MSTKTNAVPEGFDAAMEQVAAIVTQSQRKDDLFEGAKKKATEMKHKAYAACLHCIVTLDLKQGVNDTNPGHGKLFVSKLIELKVTEKTASRFWENSWLLLKHKKHGPDIRSAAETGEAKDVEIAMEKAELTSENKISKLGKDASAGTATTKDAVAKVIDQAKKTCPTVAELNRVIEGVFKLLEAVASKGADAANTLAGVQATLVKASTLAARATKANGKGTVTEPDNTHASGSV